MDNPRDFNGDPDNSYAVSGKIMLSAIVILFFVIILMICLHLYARWYIPRAHPISRPRPRPRPRHRFMRERILRCTASRGLDAAVLESLPVFVYSSKTHPDGLDCVVCLSEFEEGEAGRVLPRCNHSFHIDCIDMWFHSNSTCPLCRSLVELGQFEPENADHVVVTVNEPGSSSGTCDTCRLEEWSVETTSNSDKRKPTEFVGLTIEVPTRNYEAFENESTGCDRASSQSHSQTQTQSSFRSPVTRMLSFKRILSRERKGNSSPSGVAESCSIAEPDIDRGRDEDRQTQQC